MRPDAKPPLAGPSLPEFAGVALGIGLALLDWRNGGFVVAGFLAFLVLWVVLARMARRHPGLGLVSAVGVAAIPLAMWVGAVRLQMPYGLLMGLLAAGASWLMWPAAWNVARTALDARRAAGPAPAPDAPRTHGWLLLLAALASQTALWAADAYGDPRALRGDRGLSLAWSAGSLAGAAGVLRAAGSLPKLAWGRWPCAVLALVPGFNLPVLIGFLLVSMPWRRIAAAR